MAVSPGVVPPARASQWHAGHRLTLLTGASQWFPLLLQAMAQAQRRIWLETYIFDFAGSALEVAQALAEAARRGVQVRVMVDGVGTPVIPPPWLATWRAAGVRVAVYAPLGRLGLSLPSQWRRLHRKLCVVDDTGYCGGINVVDDWLDPTLGALPRPRLDFAVQVQGPLVEDMRHAMQQLWLAHTVPSVARRDHLERMRDALNQGLSRTPWPAAQATSWARLVLRDNLLHRRDIERAYRGAIGRARHEIWLAVAYFVPDIRLRRALRWAVQRGVKVRVLIQGEYENFMQYHAGWFTTAWCVRQGIEVYRYQPSAFHAKAAVVDGRWATIGSSNLDPLSLLLAREANVLIDDPSFAGALLQRLQHVTTHQAQPLAPLLAQRGPWQRARDVVAYVAMRTALFLTGNRY